MFDELERYRLVAEEADTTSAGEAGFDSSSSLEHQVGVESFELVLNKRMSSGQFRRWIGVLVKVLSVAHRPDGRSVSGARLTLVWEWWACEGGGVLNVIEEGNPDGEALVLIHGFMSCNAQWERNVEGLGRELRLLLVEQFGHGDSEAPDDVTRYSPQNVLAELDEVRQDRGIDRWWVGGHSLGGAIAIRYALAQPEITRGLIFTNSRAAFGLSRTAGRDDMPRPDYSAANRRNLPFHPINASRFPAELKDRLVRAADGIPPHALEHTASNSASWGSVEEMHMLSMPVLLVNGRWEKRFQPLLAEARQSIADLRIVDVEGGHAINIEQPEAFDAAVLDFISTPRAEIEDSPGVR